MKFEISYKKIQFFENNGVTWYVSMHPAFLTLRKN